MEIRRAQIADAASLGEQMKVVRDEGTWLATESDRTSAQLTEMFRSSIDKGDVVFALEDGARIVGGIGAHATEAKGVLSLGMYLLAEYRGRGCDAARRSGKERRRATGIKALRTRSDQVASHGKQ